MLLKLYAAEGVECLTRLRGMYAFAVWDEKEKKMFAARDRFGVKPFYYSMDNSSFVFASKLKAIKNYKRNLSVSQSGLYSFLRNGSITPPFVNKIKAVNDSSIYDCSAYCILFPCTDRSLVGGCLFD